MAMKLKWRTLLSMTFLTLAMLCTGARAATVPIVTGEQWTTSSDEARKAYLIGIANLIDIERAYYGANRPSDAQSFVPRFARGLQGQTLDSVKTGLDRWYAANPGQLQRPVIETIWFEMVLPGLQKNQ